MRVAILGTTSMLAADFVAFSLARACPYRFVLFARDPARIEAALRKRGVVELPECRALDSFGDEGWDAIVNFIGVGDPARAIEMGADILHITRSWDDRVLEILQHNPDCRYVFLSSGAAFGQAAGGEPVDAATSARFAINALPVSAFYGISKFYAETVHRAQTGRCIVDIRIFNYLSAAADLGHRFLVNEMIAAVKNGTVLSVDPNDMWRDYLGIEDFAALMDASLAAPAGFNQAVDAYSLAPISKMEMLALFEAEFGLRFETRGGGLNATGAKSQYYSSNRAAEALGYRPRFSSQDTLTAVTRSILAG
jgi:nucleoside-diphosphate-sugar epimerase